MKWSKLAFGMVAAVLVAGALGAAPAQAAGERGLGWRLVDTGVVSHYRGLAVVSRNVVWVSGYDGVIRRTTDGGRTWQDASPAGAETLQFRDISAFDARHAVAMAAGTGTDSRLYATADGGRTWKLSYQNDNDQAFFDCMSFSDRRHGLVMSDPVDGAFRILATRDGGKSWQVKKTTGTEANDGEYGFAASGECLTTEGNEAWFGTSGGRVFHSRDGGTTWSAEDSAVAGGESAGVFGLAFRHGRGIAVGGDFAVPDQAVKVAATKTGHSPWRSASEQPAGYRSGVAFRTWNTAIAVGLTGSSVTTDAGRTWRTFDTGQFDTVACTTDGTCWASGDLGRVAKLTR